MKLGAALFAGMMVTMVGQGMAEAAELKPFKCENMMYRHALLQVDGTSLTIADHALALRESGILGDIEQSSGLKSGEFMAYQVSLALPMASLKCQTYGKLPMICTGASDNALIEVKGSVAGSGVRPVTFRKSIKVSSYYLKGNLTVAPGGLISESGSSGDSLDQYDVHLTVSVDINGNERSLHLSPFFNVGPSQREYFYCQL